MSQSTPPAVRDGLVTALLAAAPLSALSAVRVEGDVGRGPIAVAVLGCGALSLGVIAIVARRAGEDPVVRASSGGALLASFPLALFGRLLAEKTHHRALGGVTFAVAAVVLGASSIAVILRLASLAASERRFAGAIATTLMVVSPALLVALLVVSARDPVARSAAVDAASFAAAAGMVVGLRRVRFRAAVASAGAVLWALAVTAGVALAAAAMPLRAILTARAPYSLGIGTLLGP